MSNHLDRTGSNLSTLIIKFPSGFQNDRTNIKRQDICARLTTVSKDTEDKKKHVCHLEFPCFANDSVVWLSLGLLGDPARYSAILR